MSDDKLVKVEKLVSSIDSLFETLIRSEVLIYLIGGCFVLFFVYMMTKLVVGFLAKKSHADIITSNTLVLGKVSNMLDQIKDRIE